MDKNIAALIREDAKTVHVRFQADPYRGEDAQQNGLQLLNPQQGLAYKGARGQNQLAQFGSEVYSSKTYTYVTHLDLSEGDAVIVEARNLLQVAIVAKVDSEVKVEPNSDIAYRWIVCKIDMAAHRDNVAKNDEITTLLAQSYRANLRRSFAEGILGSLPDGERAKLQNILKPAV